jgi:nucleoside-diphosphate-sugar epimerase
VKSVLVTGATGFVGSHVLAALMERSDVRVVAACRNRTRLLPAFAGEVREGDLRDNRYLEGLLDDIDVVCHAAAWASLFGHAEESQALYLHPTIRLIDKVLERRVSRFVNLSSTSAASPDKAADPMAPGLPRRFWPHLCTVVSVENYSRDHAGMGCTMVNLRLGVFVGRRYALGLLPILLPRLKTHLVPWVRGGSSRVPLVDGWDIGQAFASAATEPTLSGYESLNIIGPESPTVRELIGFLHTEFRYPEPHFSVPFPVAYTFAACLETVRRFLPWDPLVTRSIVYMLEDAHLTNADAYRKIGYQPRVQWREAVRAQVEEMAVRQARRMKMHQSVG